jgi:hypothetical protein
MMVFGFCWVVSIAFSCKQIIIASIQIKCRVVFGGVTGTCTAPVIETAMKVVLR